MKKFLCVGGKDSEIAARAITGRFEGQLLNILCTEKEAVDRIKDADVPNLLGYKYVLLLRLPVLTGTDIFSQAYINFTAVIINIDRYLPKASNIVKASIERGFEFVNAFEKSKEEQAIIVRSTIAGKNMRLEDNVVEKLAGLPFDIIDNEITKLKLLQAYPADSLMLEKAICDYQQTDYDIYFVLSKFIRGEAKAVDSSGISFKDPMSIVRPLQNLLLNLLKVGKQRQKINTITSHPTELRLLQAQCGRYSRRSLIKALSSMIDIEIAVKEGVMHTNRLMGQLAACSLEMSLI